jgi:hypothetical protein
MCHDLETMKAATYFCMLCHLDAVHSGLLVLSVSADGWHLQDFALAYFNRNFKAQSNTAIRVLRTVEALGGRATPEDIAMLVKVRLPFRPIMNGFIACVQSVPYFVLKRVQGEVPCHVVWYFA